MTIAGYSLDTSVGELELEWVANLKRFFEFRAKKIHLWQVGHRPASCFLSELFFSRKLLYC